MCSHTCIRAFYPVCLSLLSLLLLAAAVAVSRPVQGQALEDSARYRLRPGHFGPVCNLPDLSIPDNDPGGATDTLTILESGEIGDLNVTVEVTHTLVGDLVFSLRHVDSGTTVTVIDRPGVPETARGCNGNDIAATLDDEAATPIEDECGSGTPIIDGVFIPNNSLSAFDGQELAGAWRLQVSDQASGGSGTLTQWCVAGTILEADVAVGPASLESTQLPDVTVTQTLTITNEGLGNLEWSIFEETASAAGLVPGEAEAGSCVPGNILWADVAPRVGITPPGANTLAHVSFNSTGLITGTYTATLCLISNDPDESLITVPLALTVEEEKEPEEPPEKHFYLYLPVMRYNEGIYSGSGRSLTEPATGGTVRRPATAQRG